ncbi:restriction endonuclease subunit S [Fusicatenibacter saccharivorans]|uniref:restriction endonuclease subunit S n=1 Tax=Fusicatenibacter saccharivorans TaxID=1150298 RepID=UPI003F888254
MTPEQLKASILQYAIQGKLTPQLESDGTAKSLLESCYTDVEIDGRRVKQKMIAEITDDEKAFDIPESWEWVKLGNVCTIARGGSPRPIKEYITTAGDGINWIKIGDTEKDGKYICSTAEKIKPSGASKSRMVHAGDFLLTNSMSFGRPYILKVDGCIHDGWLVISQTKEVFYQDYLYWMLSSQYAYFQFCNKVSGGVVKNLNSDKVANSVFPLPPLAEQKRIVAKIEELLPYVDRYAAAYEKLEQFNAKFPEDMKKSILQYAIQGKLVEQRPEEGTGEELYRQIQYEKQRLIKEGKIKKEKPLAEITEGEKPYDIPDNWTWVRFGDLGSYKKGPFGSAITKSMFVPKGNGAIKVYEQKNAIQKDATLGDYYICRDYFESKMKGFEVFPGDIIVSCAGTIGETYVMPDEFEQGIINQALMRMKIFEPLYIPYFLTFFDFVLKKNAISSSKGSAIKNIPPFEILKNYLVPIPPLAEQKRIVAKLEEILPLCERLK